MFQKISWIYNWSFIRRQTSGASSDSEWHNEWQPVTTSGTMNDIQWQRVTTSDKEWQRVTTNDNEWYNKWQRVTTSSTTNDKRVTTNDSEWQRMATSGTTSDNEWQRMTTKGTASDNEWQRVTSLATFSFFQIREEPTTKYPKENSLNFEEDLWRRPIELRAETSP